MFGFLVVEQLCHRGDENSAQVQRKKYGGGAASLFNRHDGLPTDTHAVFQLDLGEPLGLAQRANWMRRRRRAVERVRQSAAELPLFAPARWTSSVALGDWAFGAADLCSDAADA